MGNKRDRVAQGVYKLEPGVYEVVVSTGKRADGKYGQVTKRVRGKLTDAKNVRVTMLADVAAGTVRKTEAITMAELHRRYMAVKGVRTKPGAAGLAPASVNQYEYLWALLEPHIGAQPVKKLRSIDLDQAYAEIGKQVGANTTVKAHKHVAALLARALDWELIGKNVAKKAHPPAEVPFNTTPPNADQQVALVDAAFEQETQFGALVHLAATTGARRGELGGLRWCDVDLKAGTVRFAHQAEPDGTLTPLKTQRQRTILVDADTVEVLKKHRKFCDALAKDCGGKITGDCFAFSPKPGNTEPYRKDGLTWRYRKLQQTTGLQTRLHDQRHAQATTLLAEGLSPVVVAERLGMTVEVLHSTYAHSDSEQNKRAATAGGLRRRR